MKRLLLAAAAALLAGCQTAPPVESTIATKEVDVAVAVACKPDVGPDPAYADTDAALKGAPWPTAEADLAKAPNDPVALQHVMENLFYRDKLLVAGRLQRIQRGGEVSAALRGCEGQ